MRFALELHNLISTWHDEEDTKEEVNKLRLAVKKNSCNLPMFTDGSKRSAIDTGGYQPSHRTGNAAIDAVERLEGSVYDVVPDDHETDGSTWELYEKVQDRNYISTHDVALTVLQPPPHVRIVYRQKDPEQTRIHGKARPRGIERAGHQRVRPIKIVPVSSYHLVDRKQVGPNDTIV